MASNATLPPPPGSTLSPAAGAGVPTDPQAASPAPPQPSPQMQQGTQMAINVVNGLRAIAKAFPSTAPIISEINDKMREVTMLMMSGAETGEPAAPPTNG